MGAVTKTSIEGNREDLKAFREGLGASLRKSLPLALLLCLPFTVNCRRDVTAAASEPPPIEIRATVQPAQAMTVIAQIDGQVSSIAVREGSTVTAGSEILQLANPSVERDAAYARAQREWVDARSRRSGRVPAPAAGQPRGNMEISARILELKRQRLEKMKALRNTRDITARDLEHAEVEYLAALRDYNNERRAISGVPAAAVPGESPELLRIEREKIAAEEKFALQRRSLLRVTTPIGGIVTRIHAVPGQPVFPRDPIADISDVTTMHVRGNVAPELLRFLRPGQRVDVKILSVPPRTFADEIEYVIPVQAGGARTATVVAAIPNPDGSIQPNTEALITLRSPR
jgi:membrane fusion protein, heavy metal efflux system